MPGCHVPLTEVIHLEEIVYKINELNNKIETYLSQHNFINLPHAICGRCHGTGKVVDDGIL